MASYAVAFYRYGLSAVILLPLFLRALAAQPRIVIWGIVCGISVGLGWVGFVYALRTVPLSTVGVQVTLAILMTPARAVRSLSTQMVLPSTVQQKAVPEWL